MTDTGLSWFGSQYLNRSHEHALMPAGGGYFTSVYNKINLRMAEIFSDFYRRRRWFFTSQTNVRVLSARNIFRFRFLKKCVITTDIYIRIDRKLDPARLPILLDVFQQLLLPLCIRAHTSDSQWAETVLPGISLTESGHDNDCGGV